MTCEIPGTALVEVCENYVLFLSVYLQYQKALKTIISHPCLKGIEFKPELVKFICLFKTERLLVSFLSHRGFN
jgi:hypothetical protein